MKIKTTQQKAPEPPFIPVMLEILIETREEAEMIQAIFNSLQVELVTKKEFGAATEFLKIPGVKDGVTAKLNTALEKFYAARRAL